MARTSASIRAALAMADRELHVRHPLYVITDDGYSALGAVAVEDGRYVGRDTAGRELFSRKDHDGALQAGKRHGRLVSSAWYGVRDDTPDREAVEQRIRAVGEGEIQPPAWAA